jgi:hypothetical protein
VAAMGTLVTFLPYSAVVFYVVIIADNLHWIHVTVHSDMDPVKVIRSNNYIKYDSRIKKK